MSMPGRDTSGSSSSPAKTRICKKLVIKGHASSSGASYTLFLKVQVPRTSHQELHELLQDPHIKLQDAIVHRLNASGAAPALSTSAATAASSLGIPLSIGHEMDDSFIEHTPRKGGRKSISPRVSDAAELPAVIQTDDGKVKLRTSSPSSPSSKHTTTSQHNHDFYMLTLHLIAEPLSAPPLAPFSVRLPVPVCLNNFMRLTVDESIDTDFGVQGMAVEVDPPILPISSARKPNQRRTSTASSQRALSPNSFSDDEADVTLLGSDSMDEADDDQDDTAIVGPFQACDALVVRIAAQRAGDFVVSGPPLRILPNALRVKQAISSMTYSPTAFEDPISISPVQGGSDDGATRISFDATLQLRELFFPGLDREVQVYVQLAPGASIFDWRPVAVDASRGILSWSFGHTASASSSPSQPAQVTAEGSRGRSPTFEIGDLVVLPEPSQQGTDDEDLLHVAPPKGLNDADLDYSLDLAAAPSTTKRRRFSLQSSTSTRNLPSQPPSEPSDSSTGTSGVLAITFSLLPVLQSTEPLFVSVRGTLVLNDISKRLLESRDLTSLPQGLFVPAAVTHAYEQPRLAHTESQHLQSQSPTHLQESLEDSRETVQQNQQHEKGMTMLHEQTRSPIGDAKTEEILRQALAVIAAHNESLTNARRLESPRSREGGSNWMLRASHLLWTLFLTAMVFMLFNASQTANRALSAKLDELSRIVEASARVDHSSLFSAHERGDFVSSPPEPVAPAMFVAPVVGTDGESFENDGHDSIDNSLQEELMPPAADVSQASPPWTDTLASERTELQLTSNAHGLSHYVSDWLQDMLRMPVTIIRAFLSIFIDT